MEHFEPETGNSGSRPSGWSGQFALIAGSFVGIYHTVSLNVSIPAFAGIFDADPASLQWLVTCFMLAAGMIAPISGYLGSRFGYRRFRRMHGGFDADVRMLRHCLEPRLAGRVPDDPGRVLGACSARHAGSAVSECTKGKTAAGRLRMVCGFDYRYRRSAERKRVVSRRVLADDVLGDRHPQRSRDVDRPSVFARSGFAPASRTGRVGHVSGSGRQRGLSHGIRKSPRLGTGFARSDHRAAGGNAGFHRVRCPCTPHSKSDCSSCRAHAR